MKSIKNAYLNVAKSRIYQIIVALALVSLLTYQFYPNDYSFPIFLTLVVLLFAYIVYFIYKELKHERKK